MLEHVNKYRILKLDHIWLVPNSKLFPHWIGMIHIFQPYVWYSGFAVCALVCATIGYAANWTQYENPNYVKMKNITLIIIGIMLNNVPKIVPTTWRIRFIFILWTIFCLNWTSAYTSSLITMITTPLRADDKVKNYIEQHVQN